MAVKERKVCMMTSNSHNPFLLLHFTFIPPPPPLLLNTASLKTREKMQEIRVNSEKGGTLAFISGPGLVAIMIYEVTTQA